MNESPVSPITIYSKHSSPFHCSMNPNKIIIYV